MDKAAAIAMRMTSAARTALRMTTFSILIVYMALMTKAEDKVQKAFLGVGIWLLFCALAYVVLVRMEKKGKDKNNEENRM